ncbi:MAG: tetratricopeptide repeat protein [Gammaproteobacteria bacterium]|nr:tetratricopeptide repeat protein [Gammaproteobacteria bacterium]
MHQFFKFGQIKQLVILLLFVFSTDLIAKKNIEPAYVGAKACASCHAQQFEEWQGSHHDQAMMHATDETVLGNFNRVRFEYNGITSTFFKRGIEFWVNTDGPDGKLKDYKIEFTFGVMPLQQYLIGFSDGRYQALGIAWDSRPRAQGGQRWFHLYPQQKVDHNDVLHWTRHLNNWNSRCAECHSTNLQKNYDQESNSYQTTWSEINVACESCHGPGAAHIDWSKNAEKGIKNAGLLRVLKTPGVWQRIPGASTGSMTAHNETALDNRQITVCAQCHSRRGIIQEIVNGKPNSTEILDTHLLSFIEVPLYHYDGQILDEVYVYGSFLQSKMHQRGVVCSNCHNPHSLKLKAEGNQLCYQCHAPSQFDQAEHHHHGKNSPGAKCVNCHMPETTYMVVDPRRDHSFKIPRPDMSKKLEVPNACNRCHQNKSVDWVLNNYEQWYPGRAQQPHYGYLFYAAEQSAIQALPYLLKLSKDPSQAVMIRASAVHVLRNYPNVESANAALKLLESPDALVRLAALHVLDNINLQQRTQLLWPLLDDPVKAVRLEATRLLADVGTSRQMRAALSADRETILKQAVDEYIESAKNNADLPTGQMQLGVLYQSLGQMEKAKAAYEQALVLEPYYVPALINLADWYRADQRDEDARPYLKRALEIDPNNIAANYSLGLLNIRLKQIEKAVLYLKVAAVEAPEIAHYSYVYAVARYESGQPEAAIEILKRTLSRHPGNPDLISALAGYLAKQGRMEEANHYASQLPQK